LKNGKITVIRNAIDLDEFRFNNGIRMEVRQELQWDDKFVIGHAGRFIEQKNHKFILEIFNEIHKKCPKALLVLAGDGKLLPDIKELVYKLGLGNCVQFLGIRFDMYRLMQGMDVFLFPSLYEGLGNVLTEAQAVGLHSVASDVVPNEVKMTDLVDIVSLNAPVEEWVEAVLKYDYRYERKDTHTILKANGYEIKSASIELEKYYEGLLVNE
jgi:glycosyltransferase involved in cell wall biosynthesis